MTVIQNQASQKAELWQEYRRAFEEFSEKLRRVQSLTSALGCDQVALETALLELEKARVLYSGRRDALVEHFLPSSTGDVVLGSAPRVFPQANEDRVKVFAELMWEGAGRPDGTAEDDWYRAEKIVRSAATA
jgi:Protein of unknown function (DUF2934)